MTTRALTSFLSCQHPRRDLARLLLAFCTSAAKMARRKFILALLAACICGASAVGFKGNSGMEMTSATPIYSLPRDHAFHSTAPFYQTNDYMEWYYFTSFVKDTTTNEPLTLFWTLNAQGYVDKIKMPFLSTLFSAHNMETGFFQNTIDFPTEFSTKGTGPSAKAGGLGFSYTVTDDNSVGTVSFDEKTQVWRFIAKSTESKDGSLPYAIDLTLEVFSPGYIPATPMGVETEGYNPTGDWNPATAYGLSYYITAPQALLTGTANLGDGKGTRNVRSTAWIEHQWGNFRGYSNFHSRYQWAWGRFDNGDMITWRQWHAADSADKGNGPADLTQNRYIYLRKLPHGGYATEYAFGPSIKYTIAKQHVLANGQKVPLWATLETPQGKFYLAPEFPEQAAKTSVGLYFWEGVKYIYTDPELTKRVGRSFGEFFEIPNSKFDFVRQRPKQDLARSLTGGLPEIPADAIAAVYPKREIKNSFRFPK